MAEKAKDTAGRSPEEPSPRQAQRPTQKNWQALIDEQIAEALQRGLFDDLPGAGKPLVLDDNPFAGDKRLAYHLLKANNFAPPEIELDKEIRGALERAEVLPMRLQRRAAYLAKRRLPPFPSEKREFALLVERTVEEYRTLLTEINRKILTLNLTAPAPMHRQPIDVEARVAALLQALPKLT